ncbi:MAG: hypothetical protein QOF86_3438 [Baekduia sp.]|nr:hypothetical protein [Baekduia sp.]
MSAPASAAPPVVAIDGPATGVTGMPVAFDGAGTVDPAGGLLDYAWSIDGQDLGIADPWLSLAFAHPGRHVVARKATAGDGESAELQHPIVVTGDDRSAASLAPFGTALGAVVAQVPELVVRAAPVVRLRRHRLRVELRCRGTERCRGTLRVVTLKGRLHRPVLLAQRRFDVAAGGPRVVHVRLSTQARRRLGQRSLVRATAFRGRVRVASIWGTAAYRVPVAR